MATCEATRRDGQPCKTPVVGDGSRCFAHAPELADKREQARRKGGQNRAASRRAAKLMPARLQPLFDRLDQAFTETQAGEMEPRTAQALAALARALIACVQTGEMEQRLRELEEAYRQEEGPLSQRRWGWG